MAKAQLPLLTHLQFLVLGCLLREDRPGRTIRDTLSGYGVRRSGAAFYQMMARLERARLVEGWYEPVTVGDQAVTERWYRIKPAGEKLWTETREFYHKAAPAVGTERWSDA